MQNADLLQPFEGRKAIIGASAADKYGFKPGDRTELTVSGENSAERDIPKKRRAGLYAA